MDGCKSKRPLVKTPPSQNVPKLVKTSPNTEKDWSKRPHKTSPFFKGDFLKRYGIQEKKKLVLVSGTNVCTFEMMFDRIFYVHAAIDQR